MIGSACLVGRLGAGERTALDALAGVVHRILIGDLGDRQALQPDAEARLVHHHEHGVQSAVLRPDQEAGRLIVVHDAGGVAVDAHLVLDRAAGDGIARARLAVLVDEELRHDEERDALGTLRRAFDPRQHQMDDIVRHVVLAGGNEDLLAGNLVAAVRLRNRLCAQEAEIGAAMRLRQVHGAGPFAGHHLRQVGLLLLGGAVDKDCGNRTLGQARVHHQRHIGSGGIFADGTMQRVRQPLPAEFFGDRQTYPAAVAIGLVGFLEALRRGDRAVVRPLAAFLIAGIVEWKEHFLGELRGFAQDGLDHIRRGVSKTRKVVVALETQHIVQHEERVVHRGLVDWHRSNSSNSATGSRPAFASLLQNIDVCVNVKFCIRANL